MARSDLLLSLVKAGSKGDQPAFRRSLEAMVAEERGRQHHVMADRLAQFLDQAPDPAGATMRPISARPAHLVEEIDPSRDLSSVVLSAEAVALCHELVEEQRRSELLRAHGLEPRHRVLLVGPPGNGKTSLAEALAGELAVPLLRVRYDAVIASYLGETASRLARLFDHARTRQCVLFFDEFDALGKERGDEHETGEIKRVVNSLLLSIDSLPSYVVIVAASNHPELLDRAVWRRFQVRLELPPPSPEEVLTWLRGFEARVSLKLEIADRTVKEKLSGLSYAELEEFCTSILRRAVLAGPAAKPEEIAKAQLRTLHSLTKARKA